MSLPDQGENPGHTPPQKSHRAIWLAVLATVVAIAALAGSFMLGRTTATPSDKAAVQTPAGGSQPAGPNAGGSPPPATAGQLQQSTPQAAAQPGATNADFVITDRLLAHPPTYEDHQNAPTGTIVCLGDPIRIANASSRRLGLIDTPDESGASSTLGSVEPGGVFTVVVQEPGTFFISAAGVEGLLFRYVAQPCPGGLRPSK
jgi:hypothetical protein